jgi:hypothetical protein
MAGAPLLVLHFSIWRSSTSACTLISSTLTRSVEASGPALMMARIVPQHVLGAGHSIAGDEHVVVFVAFAGRGQRAVVALLVRGAKPWSRQ